VRALASFLDEYDELDDRGWEREGFEGFRLCGGREEDLCTGRRGGEENIQAEDEEDGWPFGEGREGREEEGEKVILSLGFRRVSKSLFFG